jgi:hypothetical protein
MRSLLILSRGRVTAQGSTDELLAMSAKPVWRMPSFVWPRLKKRTTCYVPAERGRINECPEFQNDIHCSLKKELRIISGRLHRANAFVSSIAVSRWCWIGKEPFHFSDREGREEKVFVLEHYACAVIRQFFCRQDFYGSKNQAGFRADRSMRDAVLVVSDDFAGKFVTRLLMLSWFMTIPARTVLNRSALSDALMTGFNREVSTQRLLAYAFRPALPCAVEVQDTI